MIGILLMIIYLVGLVPAFISAQDLWRQNTIKWISKVALAVLIVLFSWVGYFGYWYGMRHFIVNKGHLEAGE
ncbi:MAG: hypothetical protein IKS71_05780 [Bacteroidales bacterium]|nr:hypothetical protein [Bacteroidales bacterium]